MILCFVGGNMDFRFVFQVFVSKCLIVWILHFTQYSQYKVFQLTAVFRPLKYAGTLTNLRIMTLQHRTKTRIIRKIDETSELYCFTMKTVGARIYQCQTSVCFLIALFSDSAYTVLSNGLVSFHPRFISPQVHFTPKSFHPTFISPQNHFTPRSFHPKIISPHI